MQQIDHSMECTISLYRSSSALDRIETEYGIIGLWQNMLIINLCGQNDFLIFMAYSYSCSYIECPLVQILSFVFITAFKSIKWNIHFMFDFWIFCWTHNSIILTQVSNRCFSPSQYCQEPTTKCSKQSVSFWHICVTCLPIIILICFNIMWPQKTLTDT